MTWLRKIAGARRAAQKRRAETPDYRKPEEMSDEDWRARQELYKSAREHLLALRQASSNQADQLVLTISSAFLALTATFLKDIVPLARVVYFGSMLASWALFVTAILVTFTAFYFALCAADAEDAILQRYYLQCQDDCLTEENGWNTCTRVCNAVAAFCFVLAVASFGFFVAKNAVAEQTYQQEQAKKAARITQITRAARVAKDKQIASAVHAAQVTKAKGQSKAHSHSLKHRSHL